MSELESSVLTYTNVTVDMNSPSVLQGHLNAILIRIN